MRSQNCKAFREELPTFVKILSPAATSPKHNSIIVPAIEPIKSFEKKPSQEFLSLDNKKLLQKLLSKW